MLNGLFALAGRSVLITGGTKGIGRAISLHFARAGARVVANYAHDDASAQRLIDEVGDAGAIRLCRADVTSAEGKHRLMEAIGDEPLSAFVHCAATGVHRPLAELTARHWDFTFALNVRALFELVQLLLPHLAPGSSVVALSSEGAVHAFPHYSLVGASKGALESLCRHLALELAGRDIRVNVVSPGSVPTDAWNAFPERDTRLEEARRRSPRGRLTTVEEVAQAVHFLCSDASAGITGHTLVVDGGQRIRG